MGRKDGKLYEIGQAVLFTSPMGESWKLEKGIESNVPVILLSYTFLARFEHIVSGFLLALGKFRDSLEMQGSTYLILALSRSSLESFSTNNLSGWDF